MLSLINTFAVIGIALLCLKASDSQVEGCKSGWFSCDRRPSRCLSPELVCDGENDCKDGSDEHSCDTASSDEDENQMRRRNSIAKFNVSALLDNPRLLGAIPANGSVYGVTVLGNELFVVVSASTQVKVYDTTTLTFTRNINITGSESLFVIVASPRYNSIFVSDVAQSAVYRYNLGNNVISKWSVDGICMGLSLTSAGNVLVTLFTDKNRLEEYTADGSLVRAIVLESRMYFPFKSVQQSNDRFVVSHCATDGSISYRVSQADASGRFVQDYGGPEGSGAGGFKVPSNLAVDEGDNVVVSDAYSYRVVLLSPSLTHLGYLKIPGHSMNWPFALHVDSRARRLYIGENRDEGRVFVLTA